jgi:phosphoribosylformimino-5-aminoimidazole carboxamide ribotide isomerase
MIAIPALDLRDGACVQATGSPHQEVIRIPDPAGVARAWRQYGFKHLHVIDLDAISGRGSNDAEISAVISSTDAEVQIGGGVKDRESIEQLFDEGAHRVVIGARALEEADWIAEMATTFPAHIVVAADVQDRRIMSHGWTRAHSRSALDLVEELNDLPLAALLITTIRRDRGMRAQDLSFIEDIAEAAEFAVFAAGDFQSVNDLRALADRGIAAAIIGLPLYTGAMNPRAIADEFAE